MTDFQLILDSAIGQSIVIGAVAAAFLIVTILRILNELRQDLGELRRQRRIERLQKRLAECQGSGR